MTKQMFLIIVTCLCILKVEGRGQSTTQPITPSDEYQARFDLLPNGVMSDANWVIPAGGEWQIENGILKQTASNSYSVLLCRHPVNVLNYEIEFSMYTPPNSGVSYNTGGIVFGIKNAADVTPYYWSGNNYVRFAMNTFGVANLETTSNWRVPGAGGLSFGGTDPNRWSRWRISVKGKRVRFYTNGIEVQTRLLNEVPTGYVGISSYGCVSYYGDFKMRYNFEDDVKVEIKTSSRDLDHLFSVNDKSITFNAVGDLSAGILAGMNLNADYQIVDDQNIVQQSGGISINNRQFNESIRFSPSKKGYFKMIVQVKDGVRPLHYRELSAGFISSWIGNGAEVNDRTLISIGGGDTAVDAKGEIVASKLLKNPYSVWSIGMSFIEPTQGRNRLSSYYPNNPNYNPILMYACWGKNSELIPDWAGFKATGKPTDWSIWQGFVRRTTAAAVAMLPNRRRVYELFPEAEYTWWWGTNYADFVLLNQKTAEAIRAEDPYALILGASGHATPETVSWLQSIFSAGIGAFIDQISIHMRDVNYAKNRPSESGFESLIDQVQAIATQYGKPKTLWMTEQGIKSGGAASATSFGNSSDNLAQHFLISHSKGLGEYGHYSFFDLHLDPAEQTPSNDEDQGIMNHLGAEIPVGAPGFANGKYGYYPLRMSPKPEAITLTTLSNLFEGTAPLDKSVSTSGGVRLYTHRYKGRNEILTAYYSEPTPMSVTATAKAPYAVMDLQGNILQKSKLVTGVNSIPLAVSTFPKVIREYRAEALTSHAGYLLIDDFSSYSNAEALRAPWFNDGNGDWSVVRQPSVNEGWVNVGNANRVASSIGVGDATWSDYTLDCRVKLSNFSAVGGAMMLNVRGNKGAIAGQSKGGYSLWLYSNGWMALYRPDWGYVARAGGGLCTATLPNFNQFQEQRIRFSVKGDKIRVWANGALILYGVDSAKSWGQASLGSYNCTATYYDVKVSPADAMLVDNFDLYTEGATVESPWKVDLAAGWTISGGALTGGDASKNWSSVSVGNTLWDDYVLEFKSKLLNSGAADYHTMYLNLRTDDDGKNGYTLFAAKSGFIALYRPDGTYVTKNAAGPCVANVAGFNASNWNQWKVSCVKNKITVELNGSVLFTGVDSSKYWGKALFAGYFAKVAIDDVKVSPTYLFKDDFSNVMEGEPISNPWRSGVNSDFHVENQSLVGALNDGQNEIYSYTGDESWSDYQLEFTSRVMETRSGISGGSVYVRYREGIGGVNFAFYTNGAAVLYRPNNSVMASVSLPQVDATKTHTWRIRCVGSQYSVFVDGGTVPVLTGVDTSSLSGSIGLGAYGSAVAYDNVLVVPVEKFSLYQ